MDPTELDMLLSEALDDMAVTQIIRPAAILPEAAAKTLLVALAATDARENGVWNATPSVWERFDRPWDHPHEPGASNLVGSMYVVYDSPSRYQITIFRASITILGHDQDWTVERLCDEALGFAGLSLATCPRAHLEPPPPVFPGY